MVRLAGLSIFFTSTTRVGTKTSRRFAPLLLSTLHCKKLDHMNLSSKVTIPSQVMARQVGDEQVILDLASGTYYGLDPVGARIWQLLVDGKTLQQARDIMLAEYEVSMEDIDRDLDLLVSSLCEKRLIEMSA